jgi:hypothetical protein
LGAGLIVRAAQGSPELESDLQDYAHDMDLTKIA